MKKSTIVWLVIAAALILAGGMMFGWGYSHRVSGHLFGKNNYGYSLFEKQEDFEKAFQTLYAEEIKPLISKGICALVYTQISDVEDETNGLITYDRKVLKLDKKATKDLMNSLYEEINKGI